MRRQPARPGVGLRRAGAARRRAPGRPVAHGRTIRSSDHRARSPDAAAVLDHERPSLVRERVDTLGRRLEDELIARIRCFGPQVCGDLAAGATREWLVTDGLGGYAMGTVSGLRTRRYHGLLVVAGDAGARRHWAWPPRPGRSRCPPAARVRLGSHEWALRRRRPGGHELLERFDLVDGLPRWRWRVGDGGAGAGAGDGARPLAAWRCVHRLLAGGPVAARPRRRCAPGGTRTASGTAAGRRRG